MRSVLALLTTTWLELTSASNLQNHIHPRSHGTADVYHSALLIMCSQFLKGHHSCPATLMYPRVHGCTLASKALLSVHAWGLYIVAVPFKRPRTMVQGGMTFSILKSNI